jgi:hypothetical protein
MKPGMLHNDGLHCFATPVDAVAAMLRASKAAAEKNEETDQNAKDEPLKPSPHDYLYVSDVGNTNRGPLCYSVSSGGLH